MRRVALAAATWTAAVCQFAYAQLPPPFPAPDDCYAAAVLALRPALYMPLDEPAGAVHDRAPAGYVGTPASAPEYRRPSLLPSGKGFAVRLRMQADRFDFAGFDKWGALGGGYAAAYWVRVNSMPTPPSRFAQLCGDGVDADTFFMMQYVERVLTPGGAPASPPALCPRPHYSEALGGYEPSPCTLGATFRPGDATFIGVSWNATAGETAVVINGRDWLQTGKPRGAPPPAMRTLPLRLGSDAREPGACAGPWACAGVVWLAQWRTAVDATFLASSVLLTSTRSRHSRPPSPALSPTPARLMQPPTLSWTRSPTSRRRCRRRTF